MISVIVLAKDSERTLRQTLRSLESFAEVLVVDTGSTDQSKEIARSFSNVVLLEHPFTSFGDIRNWAVPFAKNDWILQIDSDEILTTEAKEEIGHLALDENCVYSFPFHNYFNGKFIKWCGWYPDRHVRLFHRKRTTWSASLVHEQILTDKLTPISLTAPIEHFSYLCIDDFLRKMQLYSTLFAEEHRHKTKASLPIAIGHSLFAFFKAYLLKQGFLGGSEGFLIACYQMQTAFYKYLKLWELRSKN